MKHKIKIYSLFLAILVLFSGCASRAYSEGISLGIEYPESYFPLYADATIYEYEFDKNMLDVSFGISDEFDSVAQFYNELQQDEQYNVVVEKFTDTDYTSAGEVSDFTYLLEVHSPESVSEKQYFETVVNLRVVFKEYYSDDLTITPTPELASQVTPADVTASPTPTITPEPTADESNYVDNYISDFDVLSTADLEEAEIFVECLEVIESDLGNRKSISVLLKIVNYGNDHSGYIDVSEFALKDESGTLYYTDSADGIFGSGVNVLSQGFVYDYITFEVTKSTKVFSLCAPDGIGNHPNNDFELLLYPIKVPTDAGKYSGKARLGEDSASKLPTFITEQKYSFSAGYDLKLIEAMFFTNDTTQTEDNSMYSFAMEFINNSSNVIIPVEHQDFALFDTYHNIYIKPTSALTPFEELAFKPLASGLSKEYNLSFEIMEGTDESNLMLLVSTQKDSSEQIVYKVR